MIPHTETASTPSADTQSLEALARAVAERGLQVPALFLIELCKPFSGLLGACWTMGAPFVSSLVGSAALERFRSLVESPERLEELARLLEARHERH